MRRLNGWFSLFRNRILLIYVGFLKWFTRPVLISYNSTSMQSITALIRVIHVSTRGKRRVYDWSYKIPWQSWICMPRVGLPWDVGATATLENSQFSICILHSLFKITKLTVDYNQSECSCQLKWLNRELSAQSSLARGMQWAVPSYVSSSRFFDEFRSTM